MNNQFNKPIAQDSKTIGVIIITIIITAIIVGGVVYWWQRSAVKSVKEQSAQDIAQLEQQITNLQNQINQIQQQEESQNIDSNVKYQGFIKEYTDGGYGDISHYLELTDGTKLGIKVCDKRLNDIWNQILSVADSGLPVDLYSDSSQIGGLCVNGITVNY